MISMNRLHPILWLLLGLASGAGLGYIRDRGQTGDFSQYGIQLKNPKHLEQALVESIDGSPAFKSITIYNQTVRGPDGKRAAIQVVTGNYCGPLTVDEPSFNARSEKKWRAVYFISEPPFEKYPTIAAYLDTLRPQGVNYRLAWWRRPAWWYTLHIGAGVFAIGIVWPILINLLSFGTYTRPKQAAAPALPPSPPRPQLTPAVSGEQLDAAV